MESNVSPPSPVTLPSTGVFKNVSPRALQLLSTAGRFESLAHGAYLVTQGEPHHSMSVVISGSMKVYVRAHADTIQVATIKPGDTVGEMNVIDPLAKASADVVIGEPSVVFTISQKAFEELVQREPLIGLELITALGRELCQRLRKASETLLRQSEETRSNFRDMDY
jgi:CRP-like cAMP-binding protein